MPWAETDVPLTASVSAPGRAEYLRRVDVVRKTPGFVALWDFVKREQTPSGPGRFDAHQPAGSPWDFRLDVSNYVRDYWNDGPAAAYSDFPLLHRGPFGQAIRLRAETRPGFRPLLLVPRARLHNSPLDVKGPGRAVSMVVWLIRESGNHAIAGIWHEGTDLRERGSLAARVEPGKRQYALFAGLAGNDGASAVHVSENGRQSFGDMYARNLAVTPEIIPAVPAGSPAGALDAAWTTAGFVFDPARKTVTAYLDGKAAEYWIDGPSRHPFFQWPARAWLQAQLHDIPGLQPGEDPDFPKDQFYRPPERKPRSRQVLNQNGSQRVELHTFEFTKVRVTLGKDARGRFTRIVTRELAALKVNPFWFPHGLYDPKMPEDGGPFTIGRVIHSGRNPGVAGYLGGVAVFNRALTPARMLRLANLHRSGVLAAAD